MLTTLSVVSAGRAIGQSYEIGWHTIDGGNHWERQQSHVNKFLRDVFFVNKKRGWIIGGEGTILYTDNGGERWRKQFSPTNYNLNAINFVNDKKGWIVGDLGVILEYFPSSM